MPVYTRENLLSLFGYECLISNTVDFFETVILCLSMFTLEKSDRRLEES
jgi:hypothetical protein